MGVTLSDFKGRISAITDELTTLISNISDSFDTYVSSKDQDVVINNQVKDFTEKTKMYNRLFQEEEVQAQMAGGKTRHQTLQEYCIWMFFIAYAFFCKAAFTYTYIYNGFGKAVQALFLMLILLVPVVVLMVKYC